MGYDRIENGRNENDPFLLLVKVKQSMRRFEMCDAVLFITLLFL